ncbi:MAG: branched-chain amino acid ABC transporter permease [Thermodesulfobacteriota bacterium]
MTIIKSFWDHGIKVGLIGAVTALLLSLIGMVEAFSQRDIIAGIISMGHTLLVVVVIFMGYISAKQTSASRSGWPLVNSMISGLIIAGSLVLLLFLGRWINLRSIFINASPTLYNLLTFDFGIENGWIFLLISGACCGILAGVLHYTYSPVRRVLIVSFSGVTITGVLQDLIRPTLSAWGPLAAVSDRIFLGNGLSISGALALGLMIAFILIFWGKKGDSFKHHYRNLPAGRQKTVRIAAFVFLIAILLTLPQILGLFLSEVLTIVGLYILLGLGLNIVVGYAGLLDLGYVAFFAIGAYVTAILTSPELGFFSFTFWQALPFAIILGLLSGIVLGIPVLKMRGDYLAIATLGFGEIIRILVLSDFLRPWLGGAQGIGKIPKAAIAGYEFATPQQIYYLILAGCALVVFISLRLRDSRLGRAWKAMREDEDVAQAMGINLVYTKLLAFATGAGFSALSGAIFSSKLSSVYPHSFNVMISINILCLIIVGGMGNIPGVIVGAAALVGLPELLREFAEYRLLVYGAALVAMMLLRPEGLWPEALHRRELHDDQSSAADVETSSESHAGV